MKTKLEKSLLLTSIPRTFFSALQQLVQEQEKEKDKEVEERS